MGRHKLPILLEYNVSGKERKQNITKKKLHMWLQRRIQPQVLCKELSLENVRGCKREAV